MGRIESILMERDGDTADEARNRVEECRELCYDCIADGDFDGVDEMMMCELGLEPDYLFDILV